MGIIGLEEGLDLGGIDIEVMMMSSIEIESQIVGECKRSKTEFGKCERDNCLRMYFIDELGLVVEMIIDEPATGDIETDQHLIALDSHVEHPVHNLQILLSDHPVETVAEETVHHHVIRVPTAALLQLVDPHLRKLSLQRPKLLFHSPAQHVIHLHSVIAEVSHMSHAHQSVSSVVYLHLSQSIIIIYHIVYIFIYFLARSRIVSSLSILYLYLLCLLARELLLHQLTP